MEILIGLGVFLFTLLVIYQGYYFAKKIYKPEKRKVKERLKTLSASSQGSEGVDLLKKRTLSEIPWLNEMLLKASFIEQVERTHSQAATQRPLGFFIILSALLFFAGIILAAVFRIDAFAMVLLSVLLATFPFVYLYQKKKKRMEKFERQLPEALELVARALKAGHALIGGLRMVAEEFGDPAGTEFGRTLDEINFGVGVPEALTNMTQRVDCDDLKFFAVSVIIQRETGGNLAEILDSLSYLMRERFKFRGRVRTLSAEGRISAVVLVLVPFVIVAYFSLFRPEYIGILVTDPIGRVLVASALVMMGFGVYVMKKMVSLNV